MRATAIILLVAITAACAGSGGSSDGEGASSDAGGAMATRPADAQGKPAAQARNPLLGRWEPTVKGGFANDLEFTATEMVFGTTRSEDTVFAVEYEINGSNVKITSDHPLVKVFACQVESDAAMMCAMPLLGDTAYQRVTTQPR